MSVCVCAGGGFCGINQFFPTSDLRCLDLDTVLAEILRKISYCLCSRSHLHDSNVEQ